MNQIFAIFALIFLMPFSVIAQDISIAANESQSLVPKINRRPPRTPLSPTADVSLLTETVKVKGFDYFGRNTEMAAVLIGANRALQVAIFHSDDSGNKEALYLLGMTGAEWSILDREELARGSYLGVGLEAGIAGPVTLALCRLHTCSDCDFTQLFQVTGDRFEPMEIKNRGDLFSPSTFDFRPDGTLVGGARDWDSNGHGSWVDLVYRLVGAPGEIYHPEFDALASASEFSKYFRQKGIDNFDLDALKAVEVGENEDDGQIRPEIFLTCVSLLILAQSHYLYGERKILEFLNSIETQEWVVKMRSKSDRHDDQFDLALEMAKWYAH